MLLTIRFEGWMFLFKSIFANKTKATEVIVADWCSINIKVK
jgi:hypothetical protein